MNQNRNKIIRIFAGMLLMAASTPSQGQHSPLQPYQGKTAKTLEGTVQWWPERTKAPQGAPNVVWILLDDVGFGASSTFGGLIETPTFDSLANNGLRYTNFHTTGICSPTRASLLTGRNSHSVGMGHHAELGIGTPGYSGDIPLEAGTVAEIFRENGYNTFALGKWHGNRPIDLTAAGPFNRYPTGRGFDHFYGFLGGATDQWYPDLVEGITPVNLDRNEKHLNELLADKAISYIANQKSVNPEKPFFLYLAPGATHSPHQVAKEWSDKYKGKFDGGWDKYREEAFKRQQALGVIPPHVKLPPRQEGIKAWDSLSADEKKVFARFFEVYAGFLSYTDFEIGRIVKYLQQIEQLDNTLIFVVIGDNGGSKEGTYTGTTGGAEGPQGHDIAYLLSQYDKIGTAYTHPNYPLGWSQAANTPFRYWKSDANSEGATHNPLIVFYPEKIREKGGIRTQYAHVIDILPSTVELAKVKVPAVINGYKQLPLHGASFAATIADAAAPARRTVQYYELHGGRAIYKDGWKAAVYHPRGFFGTGESDPHFSPPPFEKDKWELYNLQQDWNETNNLAAQYPQKLEELKALFDKEATKYNVYPLRNYKAGMPEPVIRKKAVIYEGATARTKVYIGKGDVSITAHVLLPNAATEGVIFSNGGWSTGGTSLYIKDGKLHYTLTDAVKEITLTADRAPGQGAHTIQVKYTGENRVALLVDGAELASAQITRRGKYLSSFGGDGISLAKDQAIPVTEAYPKPFSFTGTVRSVIIEQ
jgi:arylsulfatase